MLQPSTSLWYLWYGWRKRGRLRGWKIIRWGKCWGNMLMEEYGVRERYEQLSKEAEGLEEECKKYGEAFRGIAEVLCGRTSGKGASSRDRNQVRWTEEVVKAVGEKKEV